jgi:glycerophosphoryl diester phosphodiesterase
MQVLVFGHRGAAGEAPENTMAGFRFAYDKAGVRNFELDVHLTKDGELAVVHDADLDRTTNGAGPVGNYRMAELKRLDARGAFGDYEDAVVPSLEEVLSEFSEKAGEFQLEIKTDRPEILDRACRKLNDFIIIYGIEHKVTVTSFDPYAVEKMRGLNPSLKLGFISFDYTEEVLKKAISLGCGNTCIPLKTGTKGLVNQAQVAGLEVTGWLGNTREEVDALLDWGVDSITTDYPSFVIPYLSERGFLAESRI